VLIIPGENLQNYAFSQLVIQLAYQRVWVSWGRGTGSSGKPQGYPCQSLVPFMIWTYPTNEVGGGVGWGGGLEGLFLGSITLPYYPHCHRMAMLWAFRDRVPMDPLCGSLPWILSADPFCRSSLRIPSADPLCGSLLQILSVDPFHRSIC